MGVASVHCDEQYAKGKEGSEGYSECGVWFQNGFLFRNGYTIVFCAWQGDLLAGDDRFLMELPVAKNSGKSINLVKLFNLNIS